MPRKLHMVTVRGRNHEWSLPVMADPKHAADWRDDGLDVHEPRNLAPAWVADIGLLRPWCFVQDCLHFRNPFKTG